MPHWLYVLTPPRQTFRDDMTDEESEAMSEHFRYLQRLLEEGSLVLAGPSLRPLFRPRRVRSRRRARRAKAAESDPAVVMGVQTAELSPFRLSLLRT